MQTIYITGHRNPDMDSIASSVAYAVLKNQIDSKNQYIPVRCGEMKLPTRELFKRVTIPPPKFMRDIYPKAIDVVRRDITTLNKDAPVLNAIRELDDKNLSIIPIFDDSNEFSGVVSHHEISQFFISENSGSQPIYHFRIGNFQDVVPGYFYKRGEPIELDAPLVTGTLPQTTEFNKSDLAGTTKPVLVLDLREDLIEEAVKSELPVIVITGIELDRPLNIDFSNFKGTVYISRCDTAETLRLLRLSAPVEQIMNRESPFLEGECEFKAARDRLLGSTHRGLPVMQDGKFAGIVTRRCFIEKPHKKLILVDHNELSQSIYGAEKAELLEILDHHRISTTRTRDPIYVYARPMGSTCSIVYMHYKMEGIEPTPDVATILLGGLISDSLNLCSPTTTEHDIQIARELEAISLSSREELAELIFSHSNSLITSDPKELILSDFKTYKEHDIAIGIGQVEVNTLVEVDQVKQRYLEGIDDVRNETRLDWAMLLITDVIGHDSILLTSGNTKLEKSLRFKKKENRIFELPGILSRKKQLFPEIFRVVEESRTVLTGLG